jgi:hypothetical protein
MELGGGEKELKLLTIQSTVFLVEEQELASHISLNVFIKQH